MVSFLSDPDENRAAGQRGLAVEWFHVPNLDI
jgi:hypothetical protein